MEVISREGNLLLLFENDEYDCNFLRDAIKNYKNIQILQSIPPLNYDMWKEIMLKSSTITLKNLCLANKLCHQIYTDKIFWQDKFHHDSLPLLDIKININKYVVEYSKMLKYRVIAVNIANNMINAKKLTRFFVQVKNISKMLWLPSWMIKPITTNYGMKIGLYFGIDTKDNKFYIEINKYICPCDGSKLFNQYIDYTEFTDIITLLFYYESDDKYFNLQDENTDGKGTIEMKDFTEHTRMVKKYFPIWNKNI